MKTLRCQTAGCGSEQFRIKQDEDGGKLLVCPACGSKVPIYLIMSPADEHKVEFKG